MNKNNLILAFAKNLRIERHKNMFTQEFLAEKAGITPEYIARLESGKCNPSIKVSAKLAMALGITLDTLIPPDEYQ